MREVRVPKFGMSAVEAEILEILVNVGDHVEAGTPIVEAASDKVDFAIDSETSGVVTAIHVTPGQTCAMGAVIAQIDDGR